MESIDLAKFRSHGGTFLLVLLLFLSSCTEEQPARPPRVPVPRSTPDQPDVKEPPVLPPAADLAGEEPKDRCVLPEGMQLPPGVTREQVIEKCRKRQESGGSDVRLSSEIDVPTGPIGDPRLLHQLGRLRKKIKFMADALKICEKNCKEMAASMDAMRREAEGNLQRVREEYPRFEECLSQRLAVDFVAPRKPNIRRPSSPKNQMPSLQDAKKLHRQLHRAHEKCTSFHKKLQDLDARAKTSIFSRSRMLTEIKEDKDKANHYLNRWYAAFAAAKGPMAKGCLDKLEKLAKKYSECGTLSDYKQVMQSTKKPGVRGALLQGFAACKRGAVSAGKSKYDIAEARGADGRMVRFLKSKCGKSFSPQGCH
jgi:hypothetical protein